jgi:vacuolar-type H+-ATPase subunit H
VSRLSAFTDRAAARAKSQANAAELSDQWHHAREVAEPYVTSAREQVGPYVHSAREQLEPYVTSARERLEPYVSNARDSVAPYVSTARERITPVAEKTMASAQDIASNKLKPAYDQAVATTRDTVAPAVSTALANAATSTAPARKEAKVRGTAALAALRGETVKSRRRWPMVTGVLVLGVMAGAAVAEVMRRLSNRGPGVSPTPLRPTTVTIPDPITPVKDEADDSDEVEPEPESVSSEDTAD